jgi:hypothetical protein
MQPGTSRTLDVIFVMRCRTVSGMGSEHPQVFVTDVGDEHVAR